MITAYVGMLNPAGTDVASPLIFSYMAFYSVRNQFRSQAPRGSEQPNAWTNTASATAGTLICLTAGPDRGSA